jgi:SAM-dependent methyltransferase
MRPGSLLYNVGVGSGYFNHLAASRGLSVIGCEPDPDACTAARETAPVGCEILNVGLEAFAQGRLPAAFVVMHDVLEHIDDDASAVQSLRRLVADDGVVVVSVPALNSLYGRHDEELGHYRRYTTKSLLRVLSPHFHVRRLQWYGMASIPIAFYFSRWKRQPYPVGATKSLVGNAYAAVCAIESRIPEPIGTSLIVELTPRV